MAEHVWRDMLSLPGVLVSAFALLLSSPLATSQATTAPPACPSGWRLYNGFCYIHHYRYNNNWESFRRGCLHSDAEIASITSPAEQAFVMSYLTQVLQTSYQHVYIGLTATDGHPRWEDRRPINYTNWARAQPAYSNSPDCALITYNNAVDRGQWYITRCTNGYHYGLCKRSVACQSGWFYYAKQCYKYISSQRNWPTANNLCQQTESGHLVSIGSSNEQTVLNYWLWVRGGVGATHWLWIGLNDRTVENELEWSDGSSLSYTNWRPNEPYREDSYDCGQMFKDGRALGTSGNGEWKIQDCSVFFLPYICERSADLSLIPVEDRGDFEIFTSPPQPHTEATLKCTSESMSYALKKTIAPPSLYEIPYLNNETCVPYDNGTHYKFDFDFDECGTGIIHFHGELYFSNTIKAHALHTLPGATPGPDDSTIPRLVHIQLQCKFNTEVGITTYDENYGYVVQASQSPVFNVTGLGLFSSSMNLFPSSGYSNAVEDGVTKVYRLNQRAYFEIVITSDKRLSIRARECWVNIGKHSAFPKAFVLQDGCPVIGNRAAIGFHSQPGSRAQRLSYRVFGLTGYEDRIQFFHCTVRVCDANDPTAFCNQGCDKDSFRRRRRQAEENYKVIQVSDRNANFTFSAPGFFVATSEGVSTTSTPNTRRHAILLNASSMPTHNLLFILMACFFVFLFVPGRI